MKNSSTFLLIVSLLISLQLFAQNGVEKTVMTSLTYEAGTSLLVDFDGIVEVNEWKEDYIKIIVKITTNLQNEETLHSLVASDRYFVDTEVNQFRSMKISHPYLKKIVMVNNKELEEKMEYQIFVPDYASVQVFYSNTEMMAQVYVKK